ncbi:restriction endonuclease subunit S [Chitinophaga sp. 22536]|uniref:restriction endonuclease subunit S n=1 Tax=unclassified Chitinophaga TaxID=2619133 RepID=UPI003F861BE8
MRKYDSYKDSEIEWIGEIPEHWNAKKIKYRFTVKARVGWKGLKSDEFLTEGYAYLVTGSDFKNDKVNWAECYHIDKERYIEDPYIQLENDDLLITKDGTIGKLAVVKDLDKPACLNSGIFVVRAKKDDLTTGYLFWVLKSEIFTRFNKYTSYGSTIQHLYQNVFIEFSLPFPNLSEQASIVNYLVYKTAEIETLIDHKKRLLELFEDEKTAIINQAVTKGIDPNVRTKDSGIEWLGKIPEHWELSRMKNICSVRQGLQIPIEDRLLVKVDNSLEYITIRSINNTETTKEYIKDPSSNVVCTKDDILMARTGATGEPIINVEGVFHNNFFLVDYDRTQVDRMFLYYFLKSSRIKEYLLLVAGTTTIPDLNHGAFYNTPFLKFEIKEQQSIVHQIESECREIDKKIAKTQKLIDLLTEYRTTLITEVVTGRIQVNNSNLQ